MFIIKYKSSTQLENTRIGMGEISDISHILMLYWFEPVLYLDPVSKFPETTERSGSFLGFASRRCLDIQDFEK
jgi:hypothetical protein